MIQLVPHAGFEPGEPLREIGLVAQLAEVIFEPVGAEGAEADAGRGQQGAGDGDPFGDMTFASRDATSNARVTIAAALPALAIRGGVKHRKKTASPNHGSNPWPGKAANILVASRRADCRRLLFGGDAEALFLFFLDDDVRRDHHHQAVAFRGRCRRSEQAVDVRHLLSSGTPNSLRPSRSRLMPPSSTVPPSGTLTVVRHRDDCERRQLHRGAAAGDLFGRLRLTVVVAVVVVVGRAARASRSSPSPRR